MDTAKLIQRLRLRMGDSFLARFPETEIGVYAEEALSRYSRRTGCFVERIDLELTPDGLLVLPERVVRVNAVRWNGEALEQSTFRQMASQYGPLWYEERGGEPRYLVEDFDSFDRVRVVPIPEASALEADCVVSFGEADSRVEDAVFDYVLAMLLLRDFDAGALAFYDSFNRRSGRVGNSTLRPGRLNGGCWF